MFTGQADNTSFKLWGYDANSNRTNAQFGSSNYLYAVDSTSSCLQTVAGPVAKTYTYDAAVNPLTDGAATLIWNATGKFSTTGGGIDSTFGGNAFARLKQYRAVATRDKLKRNYESMVAMACGYLWLPM